MSAALAPHCWKATSFADPEYVMDLRSPNAFCAFAITVFASCAMALPHRSARQFATPAILLNTTLSSFSLVARPIPHIVYPLGLPCAARWRRRPPHPSPHRGNPGDQLPDSGGLFPGDNWRFRGRVLKKIANLSDSCRVNRGSSRAT